MSLMQSKRDAAAYLLGLNGWEYSEEMMTSVIENQSTLNRLIWGAMQLKEGGDPLLLEAVAMLDDAGELWEP